MFIENPSLTYLPLEELQKRLVVVLLKALSAEGHTDRTLADVDSIASKVFADLRRLCSEFNGVGEGAEKIAMLIGANANESGFSGFRIRRIQSELEEFGIHVPVQDEDKNADGMRVPEGERKYQIKWETMFGGLKAEFEKMVVLPPEPIGQVFDGLTEFGGDKNDVFSDGEGVEELKKKVRELESQLKGKERELTSFRANVIHAAIVSCRN